MIRSGGIFWWLYNARPFTTPQQEPPPSPCAGRSTRYAQQQITSVPLNVSGNSHPQRESISLPWIIITRSHINNICLSKHWPESQLNQPQKYHGYMHSSEIGSLSSSKLFISWKRKISSPSVRQFSAHPVNTTPRLLDWTMWSTRSASYLPLE